MPFDPAPATPATKPLAPWLPSREVETALRDLAAYIRKIPNHRWDFSILIHNGTNPQHQCGTIGCALGHAPHVPSCAALGFRYEKKKTDMEIWQVVSGHDEYEYADIAAAFGLPLTISRALFFKPYRGSSMAWVTQDDVADHILLFVETGRVRQ